MFLLKVAWLGAIIKKIIFHNQKKKIEFYVHFVFASKVILSKEEKENFQSEWKEEEKEEERKLI